MSEFVSEESLPPVPHVYPEGCYFDSVDDISKKHITVMGLGLNGGGEATVRFLLEHGADVLVTDTKNEEALKPSIERLAEYAKTRKIDANRLVYRLGCHKIEDFASADCVIKNPVVKYDGNPFLAAAKAIETDISLFLRFSRAPIIAVTGSKGKSSTVSALHYALKKCGFNAFLGGNITVSPLTFLDQTNKKTPVILELSSWQLADLRGRKLLKPRIAIITKIVPDHQNFYHSMLAYVADKKLIYESQTKSDFTILDFDDDAAADGGTLISNWGNVFAAETKAQVLRYSKRRLPQKVSGVYTDADGNGIARLPEKFLNESTQTQSRHEKKDVIILKNLAVPGKHMRQNVLNAALVLALMKVEPEKIVKAMETWHGIEHRLEFFFERVYAFKSSADENRHNTLKIRFYNDSASTVPESAAEATQAFGEPVIFITGGTDKGLDMSPIAETIANPLSIQPSAIYLLAGTASDKIEQDFIKKRITYKGAFSSLDSLLAELKSDIEQHKGAFGIKNVVFSPGATSFGMFTNEFDRGTRFKQKVKAVFGEQSAQH